MSDMKKLPAFALFASGLLAGIIIIMVIGFRDPGKTDPAPAVQADAGGRWSAPPLPAQIDFAGEKVPMEKWDIREQLDREVLYNYYWQNNILYLMKLAGRYFPMIEAKLKAAGVPDDFKYLCIAESNMTNATSRVGAVGFWQFMKGTAPGYDIEVSETVDERYHAEKSTEAAAAYLKQAYAKFGSWTAAAASYNCGMGGYSSHSSFQGTTDYYALQLPEETQRYIFRILAFKYILSNAGQLGFALHTDSAYKPVATRTVKVNQSITNLSAWARENGSSYKELKWHNPWLRARTLTARKGKTYEIVLPAD